MRTALTCLPLVALALCAADVQAGIVNEVPSPAARQALQASVQTYDRARATQASSRLAPIAPLTGRATAALARDRRAAALQAQITAAMSERSISLRDAKLKALNPEILALRSDMVRTIGINAREAELLAAAMPPTLNVGPLLPQPQPGDILSTQVISSFPTPDSFKFECPDNDDTWKFSGPTGVHLTASGGLFNPDCRMLWAGRHSDLVQAPANATKMTVSVTGSVVLDCWAMSFAVYAHSTAGFGIRVDAPSGGAQWQETIPASPPVNLMLPMTKAPLTNISALNMFPNPLPADHGHYESNLQEGDPASSATFALPANRTTNTFEVMPYIDADADTGGAGQAWMNASINITSIKVTFYR